MVAAAVLVQVSAAVVDFSDRLAAHFVQFPASGGNEDLWEFRVSGRFSFFHGCQWVC